MSAQFNTTSFTNSTVIIPPQNPITQEALTFISVFFLATICAVLFFLLLTFCLKMAGKCCKPKDVEPRPFEEA